MHNLSCRCPGASRQSKCNLQRRSHHTEQERIAEAAAAETVAAIAASPGPVTMESAIAAAYRSRKAAVRGAPPGATNAGAAGAAFALLADRDGTKGIHLQLDISHVTRS